MRKLIVVINGKGGVGKDALCNATAREFKIKNISSIDAIKEIAKGFGWDGSKDDKSRKFLSDLKKAFSDYNDLPMRDVVGQAKTFLEDDFYQIMYVHIREPENIAEFKNRMFPISCVTILVCRKEIDSKSAYGNDSDDKVYEYSYDIVYDNNKPLEESEEDFIGLIRQLYEEN